MLVIAAVSSYVGGWARSPQRRCLCEGDFQWGSTYQKRELSTIDLDKDPIRRESECGYQYWNQHLHNQQEELE